MKRVQWHLVLVIDGIQHYYLNKSQTSKTVFLQKVDG